MRAFAIIWGSTLGIWGCRMGEKLPGFMDHQQRNLVFDGDHALLHFQVLAYAPTRCMLCDHSMRPRV
jgi:hypothetical protein